METFLAASAQVAERFPEAAFAVVGKAEDTAYMASLQAYYARRIARQQTLAAQHRGRGSQESLIKGFMTICSYALGMLTFKSPRFVDYVAGLSFKLRF